MQYRKFGKLDYSSSVLGFGCMRLPVFENDASKINAAEATKMVRHAIDNGVNYIDTAYPYHGEQSEGFVGQVLKDGYREKVRLATKLPMWLIKCKEDCSKYLDEQLQRLDLEYIDFYLLHALNKERWETVNKQDVLSFVTEEMEKGRIKHAGFSYHEDISFFRTVVDAYDWSMCQVQFNYMEDPAWIEEIRYAASKGIAVVVMEPLLGGKLAGEPPEEIKDLWNQAEIKRTPAEWAFSWVYDHPEVSLVLSGMSDMTQVQQNLRIADTAFPNSLKESELELIDKVKATFKQKVKVACTECGYCMSECPSQVHILGTLYYFNDSTAYNRLDYARGQYKSFSTRKHASACIECGKCEAVCPQKLPIIKHLKEAHAILSE